MLTSLWQLLRGVTSLTFEAKSSAGTGWDGIGTGIVSVSEPSPDVLIFSESGVWNSAGQETRFTNVFRWTLSAATIRLEHLRFGPDRPVFLFDLAPSSDGVWREVSPHTCGEDCYAGDLRVEGDVVLVNWRIRGPRKDESIRYRYQ